MKFNYNKKNMTLERRLKESAIWYSGVEENIRRFYSQDVKKYLGAQYSLEDFNYFWSQPLAGQNIRQVHSGIPQLISEKMVDLLVGNGYDIRIIDEEGQEDTYNTDRLNHILDENDFESKIQEAIELESAFGGVAFKISIIPEFKEPVIEVINPTHYEPVVKAGRIVEDIFDTYYEVDGVDYRLREIYGSDNKGSYIKYKLQKKNTSRVFSDNSAYLDTDITEIEETAHLKDIYFPGIYEKLSIYKPNKTPNSEFIGSVLGESDYSGSFGAFDAIDEILSTWIGELRDAKITKLWPENLLPRTETGKLTLPPALQKDFIIYSPGIDQEAQRVEPFIMQAEIQVEKHIESYIKWLTLVINNAGLSPLTLGITGLESIAANEQSQNAREKTSIRTRNKKLKLWTKTLKKLSDIVLIADDIRLSKINQNDSRGNYEANIVFEDYDLKTTLDRTTEAVTGLQAGAWSINSAVDYIHDDMTDEEKLMEVVRIKIEKGITIFTKDEELAYRKFVGEVKYQADQETFIEEDEELPDEEEINRSESLFSNAHESDNEEDYFEREE